MPTNAKVGTGSLRRQSQLLHARPDLLVCDVRGNVETRVSKLHEGQFDALVLAEAGLMRLGMQAEIVQILPMSVMLPAVGQGALGLETRALDVTVLRAVERLDDAETHAAVLAERSLLATLRGGCLAPVGAWGELKLANCGSLPSCLSRDGRERLVAEAAAALTRRSTSADVRRSNCLAKGAAKLIEASRDVTKTPPAV